ncbi:peptidase S1 and S6 chymotrypsin/Hap [Allomeiothermus silvanus DSM 9946]|uniref:Peptidase S1 and S6 chymotrypsin/Hap n=1 Tax=Allomeiothermus silvanus (strain ATCC 700542 / DSM 9946 / NBRC 106475 / NCIMB 13440 / VI-R2) TaxID=526227 RepID=D7BFE0_ALLS1|nr:S1C family serine protease [Allomeiothermus silvanus]ADH63493.1 peptidase S1 and S6 chymotrypsin/Hap [Allomeiothermus silvanus DSM 9946]
MRRGLVWGLVAVYLALWVVGIEVQRHAQIPLSAQQIQASLDKVYEQSRAASVRIETIPEGIGSGFFISSDGYVMTAYHVIEGAKVLNVRTARDEVLRAEVVGYDEPRDLAILRVRPSRAVPFLELETQRALQPRDLVLSIGNSRGDFIAPRPGIVTQLDRTLSPFFPAGLVASTMQLAPGDSGGPILNDRGKVVAIAVAIGRDENGFSSYGAPIVGLEGRIGELKAGAKRSWPYVGLNLAELSAQDIQELGLDAPPGVIFSRVLPGSAAERAGLEPTTLAITRGGQVVGQVGDIILEIDGHRVLTANEFAALVRAKEVGDKITLTVRRPSGKVEQIPIVLGPNPSQANQ